jgi:NADH-quinone oxidoreductase subunit A
MSSFLRQYLTVLIFGGAAVAMVGGMLGLGRLVRPVRPQPQKYLNYECGVDPVGTGWAQSHIRYYVFAYLYVVFAVDAIYLFPWATVFDAPGFGATTLVEMFVFLAFLGVGLLYAWRKGVLAWR